MAVNYFLKLDGITGDTTDAQHKGQFQILNWSWGATNPASFSGSAAGGVQGRPTLANLNLLLTVDAAAPILFKDLATGLHIATATFSAVKEGPSLPFTFLTFNLTEVFITSLQLAASDDIPSLSLSLAYKAIQLQYATQSNPGSPGTSSTAGWDITKNAAV